MISSSSRNELHVWDVETGTFKNVECPDLVHTTIFSPTNPQLLLSVSEGGIIQQWGIDGCCISSPLIGSYAAFPQMAPSLHYAIRKKKNYSKC